MKKKKINNSTEVPQTPKKYLIWDEYYNLKAWQKMPINEDTLQKWADDMRQEADNNPDLRFLSEFLRPRNIDKDDFDRLCDKYEILAQARKYYMETIAQNLYRRSVDNKANWQAVKYSLYRHSKDFAQDEKNARENKEASAASQPINLILPPIEKTNEVPEIIRITKEEEA